MPHGSRIEVAIGDTCNTLAAYFTLSWDEWTWTWTWHVYVVFCEAPPDGPVMVEYTGAALPSLPDVLHELGASRCAKYLPAAFVARTAEKLE